jgi:hypothetical protein
MTANMSLTTSPIMRWSGRVLTGLVVLFLLFDGTIKVLEMDIATQPTAQLGYPISVVFGLGILTLIIAVLYAIPRTSVFGGILLTGLLGGAIAAHLRIASPIFTHLLFPVYLGLVAWGGLLLRDPPLRGLLLPWTTEI